MELVKPGGWLFGDLGRPFLEETALSIILSDLPPVVSGQLFRLIKKFDGSPLRKSTKVLRSEYEALIKNVAGLFSSVDDPTSGELSSITFKSAFNGIEDDVLLGELPWLPQTWDRFFHLNMTSENSIFDLAGLTWGEIMGSDEANLVVLFDVYQMVFGWLESALSYPVRISSGDSFESEVKKFELSVMLRSGLTGVPSMKWADLLSTRFGWGKEKKTLDEVASVWGLSRERVRQIEEKLIRIAESRPRVTSPNISKLLSLDYGLAINDPMNAIRGGFDLNENWTLFGVKNYVSFCASPEVIEALEDVTTISPGQKKEIAGVTQAIRNARTELGVMRVDTICLPGESDPLDSRIVLEHLPHVYGYVLTSGNFAVVSRKNSNPGIFTSVANQLAVTPRLHIEQLQEGIRRQATYRQAQHVLPPADVFTELLKQNEDFKIDSEGLVTGRTEEILKDGVQGWLLDQILFSKGKVISKAQIMRLAMGAGYKISSLGVYMSFSALVRIAGEGLLTVVGASPSAEDIEYAMSVAEASYIPNEVLDYKIDSDSKEIVIRFVYSTPFLISGVLPVDKVLGNLIGPEKRSIFCCDELKTSANAKLSKGINVAGFAPFREHILDEHDIREGDALKISVGKDAVEFVW